MRVSFFMEGGMGMAETLQVIPLTDPTGEGVMSDWIDIRQVSRLRLMVVAISVHSLSEYKTFYMI